MKSLYQTSKKLIPSGVNSPVRAFGSVGGTPVFMRKGQGAYIWDEKGKRYVDFCASWGALLFGHAPKGLVRRLQREIPKGTSFGTATAKEVTLAKKVNKFFPSVEKMRLVSSGTEAVMSSIRLARGATGRKKILKIDGGYHGHVDSLLIKAGSGAATFGIPDSAGIPTELSRLTLTIPFNDIKSLEYVFEREGHNIAAFILEPVPANMGVVEPDPEYLKKARAITKQYGALLIFDEVITGFRVSKGGAQKHYGIKPDLTCLGKIMGGGMPLAAFGGAAKIMNHLAPEGAVYQAGTLSGNPVAVTASLWVMEELAKKSKNFEAIHKRAAKFYQQIWAMILDAAWPVQLNALGPMFTLFFNSGPVTDYETAKRSDTKRFAKFFHECLKNGVYLAPSQFEANFITAAHSETELKKALNVFKKALKAVF